MFLALYYGFWKCNFVSIVENCNFGMELIKLLHKIELSIFYLYDFSLKCLINSKFNLTFLFIRLKTAKRIHSTVKFFRNWCKFFNQTA